MTFESGDGSFVNWFRKKGQAPHAKDHRRAKLGPQLQHLLVMKPESRSTTSPPTGQQLVSSRRLWGEQHQGKVVETKSCGKRFPFSKSPAIVRDVVPLPSPKIPSSLCLSFVLCKLGMKVSNSRGAMGIKKDANCTIHHPVFANFGTRCIKNQEQGACFLEEGRVGVRRGGSTCVRADVPGEMASMITSVTVSIHATNQQEHPVSENPPSQTHEKTQPQEFLKNLQRWYFPHSTFHSGICWLQGSLSPQVLGWGADSTSWE